MGTSGSLRLRSQKVVQNVKRIERGNMRNYPNECTVNQEAERDFEKIYREADEDDSEVL